MTTTTQLGRRRAGEVKDAYIQVLMLLEALPLPMAVAVLERVQDRQIVRGKAEARSRAAAERKLTPDELAEGNAAAQFVIAAVRAGMRR
jgi:hypothetical protein